MSQKILTRLLIGIALSMCLISGLGARFIMTNSYSVTVYDINVVTDVGVLTGQLYKPASATATAKKPAVVLSHGYLNSAEMQDANAVELSRRDYVVFAINMYGHGGSYLFEHVNENVTSPFLPLFIANANGLYDGVNYVYNLPYVDTAKIGVSGHSLGAMSANQAVYLDDLWVKSQLDLGITVTPKISSVLLVGADATYTASNVKDASNAPISQSYYGARHVGIVAGQYDEFFFGGEDNNAPRDFLKGENAHQFINSINLTTPVSDDEAVIDALSDKVNGYYYGKVDYFGTTTDKEYMRVIYTPDEIHPWNHFSITSTGATIEFFYKANASNVTSFPTSFGTSAGNQVWWMKEMFNFIGLIGFFLFIVPFAMLLMETPFFAKLKAEGEVRSLTKPVGKWPKVVYYSAFGLTIIFSFLSFLFITKWVNVDNKAVSERITKFFNQPTTNELAAWAVFNAVIAILLFVGSYFINKKLSKPVIEEEKVPSCWGLKISFDKLVRTILLALATVATSYVLVFLVDYLYNTDYRIWTLAVKVFQNYHLWVAIKYLPFFLLFFIASAYVINVSLARKDRKEWLNILLSVLANAGGLVLVIAIQYIGFRISGYRTFPNQNLRPILAFATIPLLAIAAIYTRILYRKTENIYLCGLINGLLITMITVANTATYLI